MTIRCHHRGSNPARSCRSPGAISRHIFDWSRSHIHGPHATVPSRRHGEPLMTQAAYRVAAAAVAATIAGINPGTAQETKMPKTPLDLIHERVNNKLIRQKVILGKPAPAGAYPFQVSMLDASVKRGQEFDGHFCGASLIAPTWVLTAAHCVTVDGKIAPPKAIDVYAGSNNFKNGDRIPVKAIFRHPKFTDDYLENDVALLQLARAPKAGTKVQPISLVDPGKRVDADGAGHQRHDHGLGHDRTRSGCRNAAARLDQDGRSRGLQPEPADQAHQGSGRRSGRDRAALPHPAGQALQRPRGDRRRGHQELRHADHRQHDLRRRAGARPRRPSRSRTPVRATAAAR